MEEWRVRKETFFFFFCFFSYFTATTFRKMQFRELYTQLHEHHINVIAIYHNATLTDTDICCDPKFIASQTRYNTSSEILESVEVEKLNGTELPNSLEFSYEELANLVLNQFENSIITHSGMSNPFMPQIRCVYEVKNKFIRRVPVEEYAKTLTDHGMKINM